MASLKNILKKIPYPDEAGVQRQLVDQILKVKARLSSIRHKIFVMSGKGGVGKSAVTAQLALALARRGKKIGILDADLNGPCIPQMLGLEGRRWDFKSNGGPAEPLRGPHDIRVASMGFFLKEAEPLRWKGPMDITHAWLGMMEASALREFMGDVSWGNLELLLFDLPPGAAADKPPALLQYIPELDGAIFITTPSRVDQAVVERSRRYARALGIKSLGAIENMGGVACSSCGKTARRRSSQKPLDLLGRIPFDWDLRRSLENGKPLSERHPVSKRFGEIAKRLLKKIQ